MHQPFPQLIHNSESPTFLSLSLHNPILTALEVSILLGARNLSAHLTPLLHISFAPRRLECSSQPPVLLIPAILDNDISASTLDDSDSAKLYVTTSKTTHWLSSVEAVGTGQYRITIESD